MSIVPGVTARNRDQVVTIEVPRAPDQAGYRNRGMFAGDSADPVWKSVKSVTSLTFHPDSERLNADAFMNISRMVVTRPVFQPVSPWLYRSAPENMRDMSVTRDTLQVPTGWLKLTAPSSIDAIVVTFDVFHVLSVWLKYAATNRAASGR